MSKRKRQTASFIKYLRTSYTRKDHKKGIFGKHFYLSENNRVTRVYEKIETGKITEVVCVSLDINISANWETIVYYDNVHGSLHRHERLSIEDKSDSIVSIGIRQKGTVRRLLKWAIKDISLNYTNYKKRFLKRSNYSKSKILENLY